MLKLKLVAFLVTTLIASSAIAGECSDAKSKEFEAAKTYNVVLSECKDSDSCKKKVKKAWNVFLKAKADRMVKCDLYPEGDEV